MNEVNSQAKLEEIFRTLMYGERTPVLERSRTNCMCWDSLLQLNLIMAIEQEFQISISDQEAIALSSFSVALAIVQRKVQSTKY